MKALVTPIHVDALILPNDTVVKDAMADYSRMPYTNGIRDYNSDTPYVGDAILNVAFQDKNLMLKAGVHLHWSLPSGLTKTVGIPLLKKEQISGVRHFFQNSNDSNWVLEKQTLWNTLLIDSRWIKPINEENASVLSFDAVNRTLFDSRISALADRLNWSHDTSQAFVITLMSILSKPLGSSYPAVPNVWLVHRKVDSTITRSWIVESNYISKTKSADQGNLAAVTIPFHDDEHDNKSQPYRYMGRQIEVDTSWTSNTLKGENYINEITAVGYNPQGESKGFGEPTFAAFYPNCMSVFGCYDDEIKTKKAGMTYEVIGLYSNPENDYLVSFIRDYINRNPQDDNFSENINVLLKEEFQWNTSIEDINNIPDMGILYGKSIPKKARKIAAERISIAVGNSGTEALSAFMGSEMEGDKEKNEDLLESIQLTSKLQNKSLDIGHKFKEAQHEKGFTAFPGGTLWSIKLESITAQKASNRNDTALEEQTLPSEMAHLLTEINTLQFEYDKVAREVPDLRRQLYSDWYKYMVSAYPPIDNQTFYFNKDEVKEHIRRNAIPHLSQKIDDQGFLVVTSDENGRFEKAQTTGEENSLAGQLAFKLDLLIEATKVFNTEKIEGEKSLEERGKCLAIRQVAAPRYWRANDPVILFAENPTAGQTESLVNDRHRMPGVSEAVLCPIIEIGAIHISNFSSEAIQILLSNIHTVFQQKPETGTGSSKTIWNPFMMEWEVEYFPTLDGKNDLTENHDYHTNYVNNSFDLNETSPDFSFKEGVAIHEGASLYSGSTILTPTACVALDKAVTQFLLKFKEIQTDEKIVEKLEGLLLRFKSTNALSQSLGGFHESLLMQKQTRQLDVADPLGFTEYQQFAQNEVAPLVQKMNLTAPQPLSEFNPIRSGELTILDLRLIDSFGQTLDFIAPTITASESIKDTAQSRSLVLKPRLSQPARINFRFLSATSGDQEMNTHPASSPICGWLLPNHLDRSIMFYDQDGSAVGSVTMNAVNPWMPAPDSNSANFIDSIGNPHLRNVVRFLFDQQIDSIRTIGSSDGSFLHHFIEAMDGAMEHTDPENFAEHQDLAILMGKPVAVVRAKINLELEGYPATDQSWTHFNQELHGYGKSTDAFTEVKFPIRLGEYNQLNDGLIGYWREEEGSLGAHYFSSEAGKNSDQTIKTYVEGGAPLNMFQSIDDEPICVTMLADPRGTIHLVSGIVPVKSIAIPKNQYKDSLNKIAITFLTAPILSVQDHLKVSLPNEPGFEWKWLEKNKNRSWLEIPQSIIITQTLFDSKFSDKPELWNQLLAKNWLEVLDGEPEHALITAAVHRAFPPVKGKELDFPLATAQRLDDFFDAYGKRLEPFDQLATFNGRQIIREGWLQLKPIIK